MFSNNTILEWLLNCSRPKNYNKSGSLNLCDKIYEIWILWKFNYCLCLIHIKKSEKKYANRNVQWSLHITKLNNKYKKCELTIFITVIYTLVNEMYP